MDLIFDTLPTSWQELQRLVSQLFSELGCQTEIEKIVETVRGPVEIDVYVEDSIVTPPLVYFCECKYWKRKITKSVVHAFRTVCIDYGVNRGYLISTAGFQSGTDRAARNSNIALFSWKEFQEQFFARWLKAMGTRLAEKADWIMYRNCLGALDSYHNTKGWYRHWSEERKAQYAELKFKYSYILPDASSIHTGGRFEKRFPLIVLDPESNSRELYGIELCSYREYFDLALPFADRARTDFEEFFKDEEHQPWDL